MLWINYQLRLSSLPHPSRVHDARPGLGCNSGGQMLSWNGTFSWVSYQLPAALCKAPCSGQSKGYFMASGYLPLCYTEVISRFVSYVDTVEYQ